VQQLPCREGDQAQRTARLHEQGRSEAPMTTDIYITREEVEAKLPALLLARTVKNASTKEDNELTAIVKQWMALEGEDELFDGEHGIRAWIKEVGTSPTWNVREMPDDLILFLAHDGVLTVNNKAFESRKLNAPDGRFLDAMNHRQEGVNYQLRVEKKD
jgi:hypothetical protein